MDIRKSSGLCKQLEGIVVVEDFHLLPCVSRDIVLGISWSVTFGDMKVNWKALSKKLL